MQPDHRTSGSQTQRVEAQGQRVRRPQGLGTGFPSQTMLSDQTTGIIYLHYSEVKIGATSHLKPAPFSRSVKAETERHGAIEFSMME